MSVCCAHVKKSRVYRNVENMMTTLTHARIYWNKKKRFSAVETDCMYRQFCSLEFVHLSFSFQSKSFSIQISFVLFASFFKYAIFSCVVMISAPIATHQIDVYGWFLANRFACDCVCAIYTTVNWKAIVVVNRGSSKIQLSKKMCGKSHAAK